MPAVAQDAGEPGPFAVERRRGLHVADGVLDLGPALAQLLGVGGEGVRVHALGRGAGDESLLGLGDGGDGFGQRRAGVLVLDAARDVDARLARRVHQIPAGQRDVPGEAGPLVALGGLGHLNQDPRTFVQRPGRLAPLGERQEAVAFGADIDEAGLHALEHRRHAAQHDIADAAGILDRLHHQLDEPPLGAQRDAAAPARTGRQDFVDHCPPPARAGQPSPVSMRSTSNSGRPTTLV